MMTSEEVMVEDSTGRLITDGTWKYKIPTVACIPQELHVNFLKVHHRLLTPFLLQKSTSGSQACRRS